jgi:hypothetical protein
MSEVDVLSALQEDGYRIGDLQAVRYDKSRTDLFPDDYLDATFGGNPASDFNSIVTYLASRPILLILGRWEEQTFVELGFAFSTVTMGNNGTEKSMIAGYAMLRNAWGTEDQKIVTMLGLAYLFKEFDLKAIIGNRYAENILTERFMAKFGFKTNGEIPRFQLRGDKLVPMVVSSLMREDFEKYVESWLLEQWRAANTEPVEIEPVSEPQQEEPQDWRTKLEEVDRLAAKAQKLTIYEVKPEPVAEEQPSLPLSWL